MAKGMWCRLVCLAALLLCAVGLNIRLVSPLNNGVGRLEVYYNGSWGTVCDDDFGQQDAIVACKQLGRYETGITPKWISSFGFGSGKIWLDDLNCKGTESSLSRCSHAGWGNENCGHHEDVGIICDENEVTVKLTPKYQKGLLQVYHSGRWGTVCDDHFGQVEASVVCRALGYQAGKVIDTNSSIQMWLDDVQCTMLNTDLKDCKHRPWEKDDCSPSEAVGVECFSFAEESTAARLVSTTNTPGKGVLELYYDGQWGRVCSTGFGVEEATVACRMLGHNTIGASYIAYTKTSTPPVILDKVRCLGTELSFNECLHYPWVNVNCSSSTVDGILCPSAYSQIRLNSTIRGRGRVEVLHNNVWGTICRGSSFSSQEAQVVCKMANLPWRSASVTTSYGPGEGLVWLSNVNCAGTETSLDECSHSRWGTAISCSHSSDVGVICLGATLQIHLEPTGSVLNVLLGQVFSVVCVVDYSNSSVTSFRWTHNGRSYNGQTFNKTVTSKSDSGSLECSVGNVLASTQINVLYPPVVHLEPGNDTLDVSVGEDLRVDCVVNDANPSVHTFRWSHNGQTSTGSTFLKRNITHSDQGKLTCTADNGHMMTPGRAVALVNVRLQVPPLIGSDDTISKNQLIAIVTGSVGIVTIIILIAVIIHLKRSLHAAKLEDKPNEGSNRTEQANRADEISTSNQQSYEMMELSSGGAENTYCHFQMTPVRDDDPDQTYDNPRFAEENLKETSGTVADDYYGNIQLELSENIRQQSGKEREMRNAEGQAYDDGNVVAVTRMMTEITRKSVLDFGNRTRALGVTSELTQHYI